MLDVSSILTLQSKVLFQYLSFLNLPYQKIIDTELKIKFESKGRSEDTIVKYLLRLFTAVVSCLIRDTALSRPQYGPECSCTRLAGDYKKYALSFLCSAVVYFAYFLQSDAELRYTVNSHN